MPLESQSHIICRMLESDASSVKMLEVECGLSPWSLEDYKREVLRNDSLSIVVKNPDGYLKGFGISRLFLRGSKNGETSKGKFAEIYNICVKKTIEERELEEI